MINDNNDNDLKFIKRLPYYLIAIGISWGFFFGMLIKLGGS